ncbi:MAG: hypothetical protein U1E87_08840 [Alphaproteobacteria bacterium]
MPLTQAIAIVLVRLWAAHAFVQSALTLPYLLGSWNDESVRSLAGLLTWLALAVAAWILARPLSRVFAASVQSAAPARIGSDDLVAIGTFLIGIYLLAIRLPSALRATGEAILHVISGDNSAQTSGVFVELGHFDLANLAAQWSVIAIAFFFVFRARGLSRFFSWLRGAAPSFRSD